MRIGELAQRTGVPARLLRYYEAQGLLQPARGENGYREFDAASPERVQQVRGLIEAGLPTAIIRDLLGCLYCQPEAAPPRLTPELRDRLERHQARLDARVACLTRNRDALRAYLNAQPTPAEPAP